MAIEYEQKIGMTGEKHLRAVSVPFSPSSLVGGGWSVYGVFMVASVAPLR
jgi:hypothetical protein